MKIYKLFFIILLTLFLLACSDESTKIKNNDTELESSLNENIPVEGDALVFASIGEPLTLLPALASDSAASNITSKIYAGLVKIDEHLNIVPDLAESWEISEDELTITFTLRPDLKWHDGQALTAKDAYFTYKLMVDPKTPTAYGEDFKQIEKAEVIDDLTFRVTYKRPFAQALLTWGFKLMPAHILENKSLNDTSLTRHPIGAGPYKFVSWEAGQRIVLEANPDYYDGKPYISKQIMRIIPDQSAQLLELETGGLDMSSLTPDQYDLVGKNKQFTDKFNLFSYPSFSYTYLGFNLENNLFKDLRVRKAIAYAIDKNELVNGVLAGHGILANGPYKPGMWAYNSRVNPYPYDPNKAKEILKEVGWVDTNGDGILDKNGKNFTFTILTNQGNKVREQSGVIIQARLAEIGIKADIRVIEWAAFLKEYLDKGKFEAVIMGWTIPMDPDLYDVWHSSKTNPGELNFIKYKNKEVDKLIDQGRFNLDELIRQEAYFKIQEILYEDVPYVFLFIPLDLPVISNRVIGPKVSDAGIGYNIHKWYVPKDKQRY